MCSHMILTLPPTRGFRLTTFLSLSICKVYKEKEQIRYQRKGTHTVGTSAEGKILSRELFKERTIVN